MPAAVAVPLTVAGVGALTSLGGAKMQSNAAARSARATTDAANRAAELEAQSARDALAFTREQEETRRKEWQATQDRNFGMWQDRERMLTPYRDLGAGALGQMAQPMVRPAALQPGSFGSRLGVQ